MTLVKEAICCHWRLCTRKASYNKPLITSIRQEGSTNIPGELLMLVPLLECWLKSIVPVLHTNHVHQMAPTCPRPATPWLAGPARTFLACASSMCTRVFSSKPS
eukprot:1159938-Pelagomonas_calceolata.AAC.4